jgi:hypothetical protein
MRGLLATVALLLLAAGIICYANGWLIFNKGPESTTIEIKTKEIQRATDEAVEETVEGGKEFVKDATNTRETPRVEREPVIVTNPD